ncbi:hypothetical protein ALQ05_01213 [Pseudomonas amygdali pv. mori]|uniref:Uncharacterized protein n=1 Tax=Pseudomonas amygdali pv. mori TaxID=34065 RepID=A0A3M4L0I8_PSEA0|nr:hypothetical protein ALQ05_01213 [Pseudomonas amygdali pv. mori]RMT13495.1 hypothetical protein ALP52_02367 [Pseudomonas amygdali pv. mori]
MAFSSWEGFTSLLHSVYAMCTSFSHHMYAKSEPSIVALQIKWLKILQQGHKQALDQGSASDICLSRQVLRPNTFYLADTDTRQPRSLCNATPAAFKGNDLFMHFSIRLASSI